MTAAAASSEDPPPDTKDWTWVLQRPCPDCGFDAAIVPGPEVPARLLAGVATLRERVAAHDGTRRPGPQVWSPLEYACHVRDVCRVFGVRLAMMLGTGDPLFANWDQDATARAERYSLQDPRTVADELTEESQRLADQLAGISGPQWGRPGRRADGSAFTVESLARYCLHDVVHHAWDVTH